MSDIRSIIYGYTARRIEGLCAHAESGPGRAELAELRRGVGYAPGAIPQLWGVFLQDLPEECYSGSAETTREEWAIYTAVTLFALHQQGKSTATACMHRKDARLGLSVARLCHDMNGRYTEEDRERIARRFLPMATADSMPELVYYLRGIVQLLRAESIPLDYPQLAVDLYYYQNEATADRVRLAWGQDFYRIKHDSVENESEEKA